MAQIYAPDLRLVAEYARAGAAGKSQRENAITALQQASRDQANQTNIDQLLLQQQSRELDRQYQSATNTARLQSNEALAAQRLDYAQQKDRVDHEQARELQDSRQVSAWEMQEARQEGAWDKEQVDIVHKDVGEMQKQLAKAKLTPEGKALANKQMGVLRTLQAEQAKGMWRDPQAYRQAMGKWLDDTQRMGLENFQIVEPGEDENFGIKTKVIDGVKHQVVYDAQGRARFAPLDQPAPPKVEDPEKIKKAANDMYNDEYKAAEERLLARTVPDSKTLNKAQPKEHEIIAEMRRIKAERDKAAMEMYGPAPKVSDTMSETPPAPPAPPAAAPAPVAVPAAPPPAAAPSAPVVPPSPARRLPVAGVQDFIDSQGLSAHMGGITAEQLSVMSPDELGKVLGEAKARKAAAPLSERAKRQMQIGDQWLSQGNYGNAAAAYLSAAMEGAVLDGERETLANDYAAKHGGYEPTVTPPPQPPAAPNDYRNAAAADVIPQPPAAPPVPPPAAPTATPPSPDYMKLNGSLPPAAPPTPSIESAISEGPEVKHKFGDGLIATKQVLTLSDGRKLPVAPVEVGGKKFRAIHTGYSWQVLHTDKEGHIKPIATLSGPGAGTREKPVLVQTPDIGEVSRVLPKGVWLRDEAGRLGVIE